MPMTAQCGFLAISLREKRPAAVGIATCSAARRTHRGARINRMRVLAAILRPHPVRRPGNDFTTASTRAPPRHGLTGWHIFERSILRFQSAPALAAVQLDARRAGDQASCHRLNDGRRNRSRTTCKCPFRQTCRWAARRGTGRQQRYKNHHRRNRMVHYQDAFPISPASPPPTDASLRQSLAHPWQNGNVTSLLCTFKGYRCTQATPG